MSRTDIINFYIKKYNFKSYLEIGVERGGNFRSIRVEKRVGVDPDEHSAATVHMPSDKYFETCNEMFDIIFIDGLHHSEQVYNDYINARKHLNDNGIVVFHDCLPPTEDAQTREYWYGKEWTGDVWKAWLQIRSEFDDREMFVIDTDYGCGVIKPGINNKIELNEELTWNTFQSTYKDKMNIISEKDWKEKEVYHL